MIYEIWWHQSVGHSFVEAESFAEANDKANRGQDFGYEEHDNPIDIAVVEKEPVPPELECDVRQSYECRGCDKKAECDKDELKRQEAT
jgi:hypothetical protein